MDIEEIETAYQQDLERAEKTFLDGVKAKQPLEQIEKLYREQQRLAREKYYKAFTSYLAKQKELAKKVQKKKTVEKPTAPFRVVPGGYNLTAHQQRMYRLRLKWFHLRFRFHSFWRAHTPRLVLYYVVWMRIRMRRVISWVHDLFARIVEEIVESAEGMWKWVVESLGKAMKWLGDLPGKLLGMFKRKKKVDAEQKGEEQKESSDGK